MSKEQYVIGLDLGSYYIKASAITGKNGDIIFSSYGISQGIKNGIVTDEVRFLKAVRDVLRNLEIKIGQPIKNVYLSIDIGNTRNEFSKGSTGVTSEIFTDDEIYKVINQSLRFPTVLDDGIIDIGIVEYKIDGKPVKNPNGKKGTLIDVTTQVFFSRIKLIEDLALILRKEDIEVYGTGIQMRGVPNLVVSESSKKEGILVVDAGHSKTDVCIIKDNKILDFASFDIAGKNITKDLSIVMKVSMDEAEEMKINYGKGIITEKDSKFDLIQGIILARVDEIFESIMNFLKDSKHGSGIENVCIFGGGLCGFKNIQKYANEKLNLVTNCITSDIIKSDDIFTLNSCGVAYDIIHDEQTELQLERWDKILDKPEDDLSENTYFDKINEFGKKAKSSVKTLIDGTDNIDESYIDEDDLSSLPTDKWEETKTMSESQYESFSNYKDEDEKRDNDEELLKSEYKKKRNKEVIKKENNSNVIMDFIKKIIAWFKNLFASKDDEYYEEENKIDDSNDTDSIDVYEVKKNKYMDKKKKKIEPKEITYDLED